MSNSILDRIAKLLALQESRVESVVVPALNRRMGSLGLLDTVPGVRIYQLRGALWELGCLVREYRHDAAAGKTSARLATWARRSREALARARCDHLHPRPLHGPAGWYNL